MAQVNPSAWSGCGRAASIHMCLTSDAARHLAAEDLEDVPTTHGESAFGLPAADGHIPWNTTAESSTASSSSSSGSSISVFPFYTPSFDVAVAGALLFGALTVAHVYLSWRTRTIVFVMNIYSAAGTASPPFPTLPYPPIM